MELPLALLIAAWCIDFFWGEYPSPVHPVVWMGQTIQWFERRLLGHAPWLEKLGGCILLVSIALGFAAFAYFTIALASQWPLLSFAIGVYWLKSSFALRALGEAAQHVKDHLAQGELGEARSELRSLCSRDAKDLDATQLTEASISSLAENLSDSFIAPLFYFLIGGVPAAVLYRAVNTLDAMVGYKNHYKNLGWASARFDDLLNWIPARITTFFLFAAGLFFGRTQRRSWLVAWRDHGKTPSPNGGWPMAAMAGLLMIRLQKPGVYTLGTALRPSDEVALRDAWRLTWLAGFLGWITSLILIFTGAFA